MSLKAFHVLFVTISSAFAAGLGVWCLTLPEETAFAGARLLGAASLAASVALIVYGFWFLRKIRKWEDDEAKKHRPVPFPGGDDPRRDDR